jgi:predicted acyl esterase
MGGVTLPTNTTTSIPDNRLVYMSAPFTTTTEITGEPAVTFFVSSANTSNQGLGQLNVGLSDVDASGKASEFSHERLGLIGLGPTPIPVHMRLSVSSHRIPPGHTLMLVVASSDTAVAIPAPGPDPFFVNHDARAPSSLTIPIVPVSRIPPPGLPPSGVSYTDDPLKAICETFGLPC